MDVPTSNQDAIGKCDKGKSPLTVNNKKDDEELRVGMKVYSEEEAYNLYNDYAIRKGFSVRKAQIRRVKGVVIRHRNYVCWKEGFREVGNNIELKKVNRLDIRTGCRASIRFTVENGVWEITHFHVDHNHELAKAEQRHLIKSNRGIADAHKSVIKSMVSAGIKAAKTYSYLANEVGGIQNVGFTERDCHNFLNTQRINLIEAGDGQSVINHFKHKQAEDPMFFYSVQVDQENRMTNFFWRDGRSNLDYECFGDVLVFDTTFRTNKYNMICAPFVGVNHHWKNVLFGCAFLLDETIASFTWLFETFLEAMGNKQPKTIFTDQCQAISNAIGKVFLESRHRLCLWHISKNATQHISFLYANPEFKRVFTKCFHGCQTEIEFESTWIELVERFHVNENKWLSKLYELRTKWCPVFSLDTFSANMRSSQRSESTNRVFSEMSTKTMTLTEFIHQYEETIIGMRSKELNEDFRCSQGKPSKLIRSGILNHAAAVYTVKMFTVLEKEFIGSLAVKINEISSDGTLHTYLLIEEDCRREHIVKFNSSNNTIECSCKMFESMGLLCRHALRVLNVRNITSIPARYILNRWTKDVKKWVSEYEHGEPAHRKEKASMTLRLSDLMHAAYRVMSRSAMTKRTTKLAKKKLVELLELVDKDIACSNLNENGKEEDDESTHVDANSHNKASHSSFSQILDPPNIRPKGVSNARIKSGLEKCRRKKMKNVATSTYCTAQPEKVYHREVEQPMVTYLPQPSLHAPNNMSLLHSFSNPVGVPMTTTSHTQEVLYGANFGYSNFGFTNLDGSKNHMVYPRQDGSNGSGSIADHSHGPHGQLP